MILKQVKEGDGYCVYICSDEGEQYAKWMFTKPLTDEQAKYVLHMIKKEADRMIESMSRITGEKDV